MRICGLFTFLRSENKNLSEFLVLSVGTLTDPVFSIVLKRNGCGRRRYEFCGHRVAIQPSPGSEPLSTEAS